MSSPVARLLLRRVTPAVLGVLGLAVLPATAAGLTAPARAASAATQHAALARQARAPGGPATNWPTWQKDLIGSRYAAGETAITPGNVSQLAVKWAFTFPRIPGVFPGSQPAVVDGTLYVGSTDAKFYALDAGTGAVRWSFDLTQVAGPWTTASPDPVRDGPAVANGTVYFGDSRGYLYAVNQATGALEWATLLDSNPDIEVTGSPIVFGGRVYVGVSNKEAGYQQQDLSYPCCTARGQIVALDAATGAVVWRHYTVPPAQQVGTWPNGAAQYAPSGISVWDSPVIDPVTGTIFFGTGQNYTGTQGETDSVLALSLSTGQVRWQFQAHWPDTFTSVCDNPADAAYCPGAANGTALDWDFGASPLLFHIGARVVLGIGDKSGVYYALDAHTGSLLWSRSLTANPKLTGGQGGVQWGASYDGTRLYVATWFAQPGTLYALNPATGAIEWQDATPSDGCTTGGAAASRGCKLGFSAAVSTSPGLVFAGNGDGKEYVYSAATGALLWQFDTTQAFQGVNGAPGHGESVSGLGGAVISNGMVYVQSGYYPVNVSSEGTVLLALGLPGTAGATAAGRPPAPARAGG
jgi:polyvinyl alcohol dehydrogenase (cytochrome)